MQREVMIKKQLRNGSNQLVKATVLSERNGVLRCTQAGSVGVMKPFEVAAKDVVDASVVFSGNRLAQQRGVVPTKQYPTYGSSLAATLNAAKHTPPAKKSADTMKPSKLMHEKGITLETDGEEDMEAAPMVNPLKKVGFPKMKKPKMGMPRPIRAEDNAHGENNNDDADNNPSANFHVGDSVRHKKSGWIGKVSSIHPTKSPQHKLVRVQYQSKADTQPMLVNHHSSELEPVEQNDNAQQE